MRYPFLDFIEVFDRKVHLSGMGDRQQMQNGVRRSAQCHRDHYGIFQSFARDDVARSDIFFDQADDGFACFENILQFITGCCRI
ncbi:hypothetical protein SDC9_148932 [bioreactor metagenome]|uniref:Uncharacterized protein n=1 Tax=bioreactor metagenome TaxID=1076179 RepID=A0A645EIF2_9ZZZZ